VKDIVDAGLIPDHTPARASTPGLKKLLKLSSGREPVWARMLSGCPRSAGKPRAPSLVVGAGMNNMGVGKEGKRVVID
jgi:hypothetical protein